MSGEPAQRLGPAGEEQAARHLSRCGFEVLERNYRTRYGELDIVAFDGRTLVFCEVKSRRGRLGSLSAREAVHPLKRAQVRRMARDWLAHPEQRPFARAIRFDVIVVLFDRAGALAGLEHLEGSF